MQESGGGWGGFLEFLKSEEGQGLIKLGAQVLTSQGNQSGAGSSGGVQNYGGSYTPAFRSMMGYVGPSMSESGSTANYAIAHNANQRAYAIDYTAKQVQKYGSKWGGGGGFGMGFSMGYKGAQDTVAPYLAYKQAKFEKEMYGMQAELSELGAQAYQTAAEDVIRASHNQVAAITFNAGQAKAATRVSQAASGVRVGGTGSAAEVMASQDIVRDFQVNQTLANGITQSFGYQRAKVNAQVNALGLRAAQSAVSPWTAAICTGIQAFSSAPSIGDFNFGGGEGEGGLSDLGFEQAPGN